QSRKDRRMGFSDLVDKAKGLISGNKDSVKDGIDQAADVADDKTGGQHSEHIDKGADMAKDQVDNLDGE
ncbi:MAG: antitoxin, partial [Actinomycetota bacterium]